MPSVTVPVWRVLVWNAAEQRNVVHATRDEQRDAEAIAESLQHRNPRARVSVAPATKRVLTIRPPVNNAAREHRIEAAGRISDRADACKRYKSPGSDQIAL